MISEKIFILFFIELKIYNILLNKLIQIKDYKKFIFIKTNLYFNKI